MCKKKVVIIEDEFFVAHELAKLVENSGFEVMESFHSAEAFLKGDKWNFDVALVDVFLADQMTGFELAEHFNRRNKSFIFVTANQDKAALETAANLGPKAFVAKPFKDVDVEAALKIAVHQLPQNIRVMTHRGAENICADDVLFIKSEGAYIHIQTTSNNLVQRKLLKEIEGELGQSFIRVHRSYIVNRKLIKAQNSSHVMVGDFEVPLSRNFKLDLLV